MSRKSNQTASVDALEEIEGAADRMAQWVQDHLWIVISVVLLTILASGGVQLYANAGEQREIAASAALEAVRGEYLAAMGAQPGALDVPELANPAAAQAIRDTYLERFREVAVEHAGSVAAALAQLEVGSLLEQSGESGQTAEVWQQTLAGLPNDAPLRGILLQRLAAVHEDAGRWIEAAKSHESASEVNDFPLRYGALSDAARCYAEGGDSAKALELLEIVETQASDALIPDHVRQLMRELRAASAS